jgi:hypothetical protein
MVNCGRTHKEVFYIQTLTHLNLNDRSMTAPPPVLSPSSILPTPSSQCSFIPASKIRRALKTVIVSIFNVVELRASEIP